MTAEQTPQWLLWAREVQALAQTGKEYTRNEFDQQRYQRLSEIAAEIMAEHTQLSLPEVVAEFDLQKGYATPRVDVRAAVFREGALLMVNERMDGSWAMPGGWADVGDVPSEAAERETWEEAGFKVRTTRVVGVYDANRIPGHMALYHAFKLIFLCEIISGEARPSMETLDVQFFQRDEIPEDKLRSRTTLRQIEDAFAVHADPDLPTVFD